jgi:hypothetical protein
MPTLNTLIQTAQQEGGMLDAQKILGLLQQNVAESGSNQTITQMLGLSGTLNQLQLSNDISPIWYFSNPLLASGSCYTLIGDQIMYGWMHNCKGLDASGNLLGSYDSGAVTMYVITEGNTSASGSPLIKVYNSPAAAAGTVPTFTLMSSVDTGLGKSVVSTASLTAYTLVSQKTYWTGSAGASMAVTFPAAAAGIDALIFTIMSVNARASATYISTGATFVGAPATLAALTPYKFQYDQGTTAWYITA